MSERLKWRFSVAGRRLALTAAATRPVTMAFTRLAVEVTAARVQSAAMSGRFGHVQLLRTLADETAERRVRGLG